MKLFVFSLISLLFVIALADAKTCVGSRCKRMTKVMANLYNDYDYGFSGGNGGGPYNNQDRDSDCPNCYARDFGNGDYSHNTINIEKK